MSAVGIIPCRLASSRLPGKVLAEIAGKPMLVHVARAARQARLLDAVYVASADAPILAAARAQGLATLETSGRHATGSDCVAEAAQQIDADLYVNIQGDEPLIEPQAIDAVVEALMQAPDAVAALGAWTPIADIGAALDVNTVKALIGANRRALAFSRLPVPHAKGLPRPGGAPCGWKRQLGLYAFRPAALEAFLRHAPGPLERTEGIEMYRLLEHGAPLLMIELATGSIAVDTAEDLERVRRLMAAREHHDL